MKTTTAFLVAVILYSLAGCAKFPHQQGSWVGVVERRTFFTARGQARDALILKMEAGPRMGDASFRGLKVPSSEREKFFCSEPILVGEDRKTFNFFHLEGKRVKVTGKVQYGPALVS